MEAAGHGNSNDLVAVWRDDGGELRDAVRVAAGGESDEQFAAEAEDVAAFQHARKLDMLKFAKRRDGGRERGCFAAAALSAHGENHGELVEDERGIFDKHGIGQIGLCGKRSDAGAKIGKKFFVGVVLGLRFGQINRLARDEAEFALWKRRADGAGDGSEHSGECNR